MNTYRTNNAFTIIELLIALSIIVIIIALSLPAIAAMRSVTELQAAESKTITMLQNSRNLLGNLTREDLDKQIPRVRGSDYSGTGIVIHYPAKLQNRLEIAVINNNQFLEDVDGDYFERSDISGKSSREAYAILQTENPAWLSANVLLVGFALDPTNTEELVAVAPPFAVCFDTRSTCRSPVAPGDYIYCDLNQDDIIDELGSEGQIPVAISGICVIDMNSAEKAFGNRLNQITNGQYTNITPEEFLEQTKNHAIMTAVQNAEPLHYP